MHSFIHSLIQMLYWLIVLCQPSLVAKDEDKDSTLKELAVEQRRQHEYLDGEIFPSSPPSSPLTSGNMDGLLNSLSPAQNKNCN